MPNPVIKSVGRTFDILDYYREVKRPLSVRDIAERFGYPLISASALLKSLATLGYLTYDRYSHLYFPSMKLPLLAEWVYESTYIIVASQSDIYMNFVVLIPSRYELQFNPVGMVRRPLCLSGTGLSLERPVGRCNKESLSALRAQVEQERISAQSDPGSGSGAGLIAMPLPDREAGSNMAISVSGILDRMQANSAGIVREMRKLLNQYAKRGSR
jgi:IclR family transcriptional regulator, KDG regulon repressor